MQTIGVFDSGLGGLSVLRVLLRRFPGYQYLYFGDFAHLPYGSRHPDEIRKFALDISEYLLDEGAEALVMACNISSSVALEAARERFRVPVFGMIEGGVKGAMRATKKGRVAVLTTPATAQVGAYSRELNRAGLAASEVACPEWVPLIESHYALAGVGEIHPAICARVQEALQFSPDVIILGCTHYPLVESWIQQCVPAGITLVDPAQEIVSDLSKYLNQNSANPNSPALSFRLSAEPNRFAKSARAILGLRSLPSDILVVRKELVFKERLR
ncbi:MAG: glutamate racemase [bacterium JZ-2024 1]